MLKSRSTRSRR